MQDYRRLRVWRKARGHVLNARRATHRFPPRGYATLSSQLMRAAESIPFNIVEGCGNRSQRDFARFLDNSIKSCSELEYQLFLAMDYEVLAKDDWKSLTDETIDVRRMLCGLGAKVLQLEGSRSISDSTTESAITNHSKRAN